MTKDFERFIEISAVNTVRNALRTAERFRFPVLVIGDPGLGKTTAMRHIAREVQAAYCEVGQHNKTVRGLYRMIVEAYGIRVDREFARDLASLCFDTLAPGSYRSTWPLLVDEYQNLPPAMLRELLHVQEKCELTLVLAGNKERLARTAASAGALDQIESRIGMRFRIDRPTPADCTSIGVEYNVEGRDAYTAIEAYGVRSTVRKLVRLLEVCAEATGGKGGIKLPEIKEAIRLLHPEIADPLKLLSAN